VFFPAPDRVLGYGRIMSEEFWDAVAPFMAGDQLREGTIMGTKCARSTSGEFVAMPYHKGPGLVVKLPRERVVELIEGGTGQSFAPAKKVFKEWVLVDTHAEEQWKQLLQESIDFVG